MGEGLHATQATGGLREEGKPTSAWAQKIEPGHWGVSLFQTPGNCGCPCFAIWLFRRGCPCLSVHFSLGAKDRARSLGVSLFQTPGNCGCPCFAVLVLLRRVVPLCQRPRRTGMEFVAIGDEHQPVARMRTPGERDQAHGVVFGTDRVRITTSTRDGAVQHTEGAARPIPGVTAAPVAVPHRPVASRHDFRP